MKKLIVITLCAALVAAPVQRTEAYAAMAVCLIGGATITFAGVIFLLKTCKPKYYCVQDEDGKRFASNATRTERAANDWKVVSGPYTSAEQANAVCPPATNAPTATTSGLVLTSDLETGDDPGVFIPMKPIHIWRSTNLVDWTLAETIWDDPTHFSWSQTNSLAEPAVFYKASY